MYLRTAHAESYIPLLRQFIRDNPLGILTTAIPSKSQSLIQSSHIPWLLDIEDESSETELGVLRGHMARANPQCKSIIESLVPSTEATDGVANARYINGTAIDRSFLEQEVYILFNGPAHSYVTPKFYVATKPATGKVVPTWNYSAVQIYGRAKIYYDPKSPSTDDFLQRQLADLSTFSETKQMGYTGTQGKPKPWGVDDAPETYVAMLKKAIIGVEITVERMEGKFKMSQELTLGDRAGVIDGFKGLGTEQGEILAKAVEERGIRKDKSK